MPFSYSEIPNNSPHSSLFLHPYLLSPNSIIVMKFKFKIQQYQTEAVENTVNVFEGQPAQQGQKGYRIDLGIELSAKIEKTEIAGKEVWCVDGGYLMACFDREVNEATITEIAKQKPVYFVMRDASAANDNVLDNFDQLFVNYSPDTTCKIL